MNDRDDRLSWEEACVEVGLAGGTAVVLERLAAAAAARRPGDSGLLSTHVAQAAKVARVAPGLACFHLGRAVQAAVGAGWEADAAAVATHLAWMIAGYVPADIEVESLLVRIGRIAAGGGGG